MPSLEESRRLVEQELASRDVHDDILSGLQYEIDKHNAIKDTLRHSLPRNRHSTHPTSRLRFKSDHDDRARKLKRRERRPRRHTSRDSNSGPDLESHPFPREPVDTDIDLNLNTADDPPSNSDNAFRESLFDALADDEGAQYWETIYNQPIHIYPRPKKATVTGELEKMSDEEYVQYVKTKMWEKKNPHVAIERERAERERKKAEEERTREREEYVRRKQQAAWERAEKENYRRERFAGEREEDSERVFAGHGNFDGERGDDADGISQEFAAAWEKYLKSWEILLADLTTKSSVQDPDIATISASRRIPWPVLPSQPTTRPHIEEFFRRAPCKTSTERIQLLKMERVRWHPDKVQQRFAGTVDEGTMKVVTGIFQTIDGMWDEMRKK